MRDYAIVLPEFWIGATGRVLRTKDPSVRELAFYLFSAPNSSMYGLYYKPVPVMVLETGRPEKTVVAAITALEELSYCSFDTKTDFVWVFEMAEIQLRPLPLRTGDYKIAAATRWYLSAPKNPFLGPFYDKYAEKLRLDCARRSEGVVTPRVDTAKEGTVGVSLISGSGSGSESSSFLRFWAVWPQTRRVGKKAARIQWDKLNPPPEQVEEILRAVERQKRQSDWIKEGGQYIPHPERYLKYRRWEDENVEVTTLSDRTTKSIKAALEFVAEGGHGGESGQGLLLGEDSGAGGGNGEVQRTGEAGAFGLLGEPEGHPSGGGSHGHRPVHQGLRALPVRR